ncbi:MAG: helix-turn-helix domain-containing protein [Dehalococcoidia bacterium]|nr:helix-turn-helix domain-containing protein [Dehalococcoidia bacterium]
MSTSSAAAVMDVVPERFPYRDEGCELSQSCLRCPLPQCKYDDPGWLQREKRKARDSRIVEALWHDGISVSEASARFALSPRTIFRIVKRATQDRPRLSGLEDHARAA